MVRIFARRSTASALTSDPRSGTSTPSSADGLPLAVQVIGPRYREDLCLDAAAVIEGQLGILTPIEPT
jgi:Asp-tRNA(Asn)/Glu-tRNA(Gln) amidotransferase A subunit family amidase